jgi:hypothetical protein
MFACFGSTLDLRPVMTMPCCQDDSFDFAVGQDRIEPVYQFEAVFPCECLRFR